MKTILNIIKEKAFCHGALPYSYAFLSGALGALVILLFFHVIESRQTPRMGTVNVTALVDAFIKTHAQQSLTPTQQQQRVKAFGQQLEKTLHEIAIQYHVILMPSEAVIAGSRDFTPLLQQRLQAIK